MAILHQVLESDRPELQFSLVIYHFELQLLFVLFLLFFSTKCEMRATLSLFLL